MSTHGSDTWRSLLSRALTALEALPRAGLSVPEWSFGGGTVLMLRYGHRTSRDVDIFIHDAQYLTALSPRLNDVTAGLTEDYEESSSYLRLAFDEGEVDFIVAPDLLGLEHPILEFEGRRLRTDASEEIVAKKLFYRTATLKVRDVIDLAVVLANEPDAAGRIGIVVGKKRAQLERRLELLGRDFEARAAREVDLLSAGEAIVGAAMKRARDFVASLA